MRTTLLMTLVAMTVTLLSFATPAVAADYELEIVTPHNDDIQFEFERAFAAHLGRPVKIRWIKRGTVEIIQLLDGRDRAAKGESFDLDVFFGGGVPYHDLAAEKGYLEAPDLPAAILAGIPKEIAGVANYDAKHHRWFGAALSSFGVLMNRRGLQNQNLPEIERWADLSRPEMFSWVAIADPRKSASVLVSYELILQQHGWEKGWPMLMRIAANSRQITDSSSAIPNLVATGDALAGPCIDFYAYSRVAQAGDKVLAYVNPKGGSAITPDPISMLRKPPHRELAEKFVAFVLSPAGQRLWVLPPGTPGGPAEHALFRMPIRPDVCQEHVDQMVIKDPYEQAAEGAFREVSDDKQRRRRVLLAELMGAALVDLHRDLKDAWQALVDGGMKPAAVAEWNKLPFSEEEGWKLAETLEAGGRDAKSITRDWTREFRRKYDRVKRLSR